MAINTWPVYSTGTINTNQVCPSKNSMATQHIQSRDTINVSPGCYVRMIDHVISADESETIEIQMKTMEWAGELTDLFGCKNTKALHQAIPGLRSKYNGEFDATIPLDKLNAMKTPDPNWAFTSLAAMFVAALIIFLIGVCLRRKCCCSQELATLTPSLQPPMPMQTPASLIQPPVVAVQMAAPINQAKKSNNTSVPITISFT